MESLAAFFHSLVVHFGLPGLFVVMAIGNIGVPVGTEVVMPTAGALAGGGHFPSLGPIPAWVLVALVGTAGEVAGGMILYAIGWYGGLAFVHRYGKYVHFREHELDRVHGFYERHGRSTVFWCRFVPLIRGIGALPPGISRMPKRYFLTFTALGSAIFCFALAYAGEVAGHNVDAITAYVHDFFLAILGVVALGAIIAFVWWRVVKARRARAERAGVGRVIR